jgi:hypothetical protein
VSDVNTVEGDFSRRISLIIISSLKIARRRIQLIRIQILETPAIECNRQSTLLIAKLECEDRAYIDMTNRLANLVTSSGGLRDTNFNVTIGFVVKLGDGLVGRQVVEDLADGDAAVAGDFDGKSDFEAIDIVVWTPAIRAAFAQLGATVIAVRCCHAAT